MGSQVKNRTSAPEGQALEEEGKLAEESHLVRQRLRNLIEIAVDIGQREGLLGNHKIARGALAETAKSTQRCGAKGGRSQVTQSADRRDGS